MFSRLTCCFLAMLASGTYAAPLKTHAVIQSYHRATLSSQISGQILKIPFKEGDPFEKDATLIAFQCTRHQADLAKALAEVSARKVDYTAAARLHRLQAGSRVDLENSKAKYLQAQADVKLQQHLVDQCTIKAPFPGAVSHIHVKQYETVRQNTPLIEVINNQTLHVEMIIPSKWLKWLKVGTPFRILVSENQQEYRGTVHKINAKIDPISQSVKVIGHLQQTQGLLVGMSGAAFFGE